MTSGTARPRGAKGTRQLLPSLALIVGLAGCASVVDIPVETPLQSKLDVTRFRRLLVAGFVTDASDEVDLQAETVRLLQNHLRANGKLRVVEADQPPLEDALEQLGRQARQGGGLSRAEREQRLADADRLLQDADLWRRVGEEYQQPLIISGRVSFEVKDRSGFEAEERILRDVSGSPYRPGGRRYAERRGYTLTADFHFIDGRTGETLHKEKFTEEVLYSEEHRVSSLSAYFELMDRVLPNVLGVISTQRIRGTRVLLRK
jgi:hypothetical protein